MANFKTNVRAYKRPHIHTNNQPTIQIANRRYTHTVKRSSIEQLNNVKMHKHTPNRIFQTNWFWSFILVESRRRVIWRIISCIRSYNLFDIIVEIHTYIQFLFFSFRFLFVLRVLPQLLFFYSPSFGTRCAAILVVATTKMDVNLHIHPFNFPAWKRIKKYYMNYIEHKKNRP